MHATRSSKLRVYSQPLRGSFAAFEVHRAAEIAGNIAHEICGRNGIWNFSAHLLHVLDDAFLGVGVVDLPTFVRILLLLSTLLGGGRGGRLLLFLLLSTLLGGGGGRPRRLLSTLRGGPATTAVCALAGRNCSGNAILRDSTSSPRRRLRRVRRRAAHPSRKHSVCRWESSARATHPPSPRPALTPSARESGRRASRCVTCPKTTAFCTG